MSYHRSASSDLRAQSSYNHLVKLANAAMFIRRFNQLERMHMLKSADGAPTFPNPETQGLSGRVPGVNTGVASQPSNILGSPMNNAQGNMQIGNNHSGAPSNYFRDYTNAARLFGYNNPRAWMDSNTPWYHRVGQALINSSPLFQGINGVSMGINAMRNGFRGGRGGQPTPTVSQGTPRLVQTPGEI